MTRNTKVHLSLALALASVGGALPLPAAAQSCPNGVCPPVVVTAPRIGGGTVLCYGMDCAGILSQLSWTPPPLNLNEATLVDDQAVDPEAFCEGLKGQRPEDCSADGSGVPPAPGVNTSMPAFLALHANGCGDGSWQFEAANLAARFNVDGYTGNPDEPLPGLQIRDICNVHDACYAGGGDKPTCDANFGSALEERLRTQYVPDSAAYQYARNVMQAYSAAVGLFGTRAYENALNAYKCAVWNANMENNQCEH